MKLLKKLIRLHKFLFLTATLLVCLSVFLNLYWNSFLAEMIDSLGTVMTFELRDKTAALSGIFITTVFITIFHTASEYASACLASYTCELFAHEMRMGYAMFYLKSDVRTLSNLNAGEEQSAMQNELNELSVYLNNALFSFIKQSLSFVLTIIFLSYKNFRLAMLSVLPVIPLILYCSFSGKIIQRHTGQCLEKKKQINGLTDTVLESFPVIQIYNAYRLIDDAMNKQLLTWQEHNIRKERVSAGFRRFLASADRLEKKVLLQNTAS